MGGRRLSTDSNSITTIKCRFGTIKELRRIELHPSETNEEIILRVIKFYNIAKENERDSGDDEEDFDDEIDEEDKNE